MSADAVGNRLFARTTIAIAFQRMMLLIRRSISRLPGYGGCSVDRNRVDVGRCQLQRQLDALAHGLILQHRQQELGPLAALAVQDVLQRVEPFLRLGRIDVRRRRRGWGDDRLFAVGEDLGICHGVLSMGAMLLSGLRRAPGSRRTGLSSYCRFPADYPERQAGRENRVRMLGSGPDHLGPRVPFGVRTGFLGDSFNPQPSGEDKRSMNSSSPDGCGLNEPRLTAAG